MKRLALLLFLVTFPVSAQDLAGYQKVLLPMLTSTPIHGANGLVFSSQLYAAAPVKTTAYWGTSSVSTTITDFPVPLVNPGPESAWHGRILFLPPDANVSFDYFLTTTATANWSTAPRLPVVREHDLRTGPSYILNVLTTAILETSTGIPRPTGKYAERHALRIYDVDNTGRLSVEVTFFGLIDTFPSDGMRIDVNRREGDDASYPYFGERLFDGICVRSGSLHQCLGGLVRVVITPNDPTIRYFALLSTTNNTTQEVTIRMPQ